MVADASTASSLCCANAEKYNSGLAGSSIVESFVSYHNRMSPDLPPQLEKTPYPPVPHKLAEHEAEQLISNETPRNVCGANVSVMKHVVRSNVAKRGQLFRPGELVPTEF